MARKKDVHLAHLVERDGNSREQSVHEHARQTAAYAGECLKHAGLVDTGYLAGLLHDMGKCRTAFTTYLKQAVAGQHPAKINHTFAAVKFIMEKAEHLENKDTLSTLACEILASAVGMHHGLWDIYKPLDPSAKDGLSHRVETPEEEIGYSEVVHNFFQEVADEQEVDSLFLKSIEELRHMVQKILQIKDFQSEGKKLCCGYLTRLISSAVIEGDRRDTAEFNDEKNDEKTKEKNRKRYQGSKDFWQENLTVMEEKMRTDFEYTTAISKVRGQISEQCKAFAKREGGIYRLTVDTGGGKTLSSLRYSLAHAMEYEKDRIIFIIPLLSVLDQNSKDIKDYLKDSNAVLEHHSNVVNTEEDEEVCSQRELLMESWDAPIIVSTMVQLLHVLFSEKTSAIRRMQSLCNSVIVIDEIQMLPLKFMQLFAAQLEFLAACCGTTIVLCSATQPAFDRLNWPVHFSEKAEMVRLDQETEKVFKRVNIVDRTIPEGISLEELADFAQEEILQKDSLLVICNTKNTAKELYRKLEQCKENDWELYYLSTALCGKHREQVLAAIGKTPGLREDRKVICVSTQMIECGIDVSFQCVIRVLAGIENIVQTAGRCNRGNEWNRICDMFIVNLQEESLRFLQEIKEAQDCCRQILNLQRGKVDLLSKDTISAYYTALMDSTYFKKQITYPVKISDLGFSILELLSVNRCNEDRKRILRQAFLTAGKNCEVFDTKKTDVIVEFDDDAKKAIDNLTSKQGFSNGVIRDLSFVKQQLTELRPYTVSLFDWELAKLRENQKIDENRVPGVIFLDSAAYDSREGVRIDQYEKKGDFLNA